MTEAILILRWLKAATLRFTNFETSVSYQFLLKTSLPPHLDLLIRKTCRVPIGSEIKNKKTIHFALTIE